MIDFSKALGTDNIGVDPLKSRVPDYKSEVYGSKRASATKIYSVLVCFKTKGNCIKFQTRESVIPQFNNGKDFILVQDTDNNNILINTREVICVKQWEG